MSKTRQNSWVTVLSYDYTPGARIPTHHHEEHQLIYAQRGVMTVSSPEGSWVVPPQRALWLPRRQRHSIALSGRVEMRTLYFNTRAILPQCTVVEVSPLLRELILHIVSLRGLSRSSSLDKSRLALLSSELRAAPAPAMHLPRPDDSRLREVLTRLREQPNRQLDHAYLLKGTGLSVRTLQRLCVQQTGIPFGQFARQVRLMKSLELLALGGSVTTVGFECGYARTSAFIQAFGRCFGVTPGRYFASA